MTPLEERKIRVLNEWLRKADLDLARNAILPLLPVLP